MSDQTFKPNKLEDIAKALGEQARSLPKPRDTAAPTRSQRARMSATEADQLRQDRDLQLLREQIDDLAGQAWTLFRRYSPDATGDPIVAAQGSPPGATSPGDRSTAARATEPEASSSHGGSQR